MRTMPERQVMVDIAAARSAGAGALSPVATGRVVQVATSPGGVPKLPVPSAHVGRLGLEGDLHNDLEGHGGPLRAVSLLAIEAIRRVAAEGNPIAPGTTGENVTTESIELGALPYGTRLAIGSELVIELTSPANPCKNIVHNFADGRFARLSAKVHPLDTRVYASVIREGSSAAGDEIRVIEAPATDG
jgi:MOSC domain-containing protein YiiM